jgi:hypothetical protein
LPIIHVHTQTPLEEITLKQLHGSHDDSAYNTEKNPKEHYLLTSLEPLWLTIHISASGPAAHELNHDYGKDKNADQQKEKDSDAEILTVQPFNPPLIINDRPSLDGKRTACN